MADQENIKPAESGDEWASTATPKPEPTEAPKRRGRPPKNRAPLEQRIEGEQPKSGPKARKAKERATFSDEVKEQVAKQVVGIHALAALATGLPELNISLVEGAILANSMIAVAEEYGLELSGKVGAGLQLFGAAAMIYLPRVMAIKKRHDAQRPIDGAIAENPQG